MPDLQAQFESAVEFHRRGQLPQAQKTYEDILRSQPGHPRASHGLAMLYLQRGMPDRAEEHLTRALRADPDNASLHHDHGLALHALGHYDDAIAAFDRSIALAPESPSAFYRRGTALLRSGRAEDAVASFDAALAFQPDNLMAINERANALRELNRLEEALAGYEKAVSMKPDMPLTLYNLALAQQDSGHFEEASANYDRVLALKPAFHEARKARGTLRLLHGNVREGLADFESRLFRSDQMLEQAVRKIPQWTGQDIAGKSLLVYGDGAFGDLVQFGRYLPLLAKTKVVLLAPIQFHRVLSANALCAHVVADAADAGPVDFRCEIMSLPFLLGTRPDSIPPCVNLFRRDEGKVAAWAARLGRDRLNVGICWQGNPTRNIDRGRSIPLHHFKTLSDIPGVRLVSLQKRHGLDQLQTLPEGMRVETLGDDFDAGADAFVDTLAVLESLDLVVTSDTAIAHVAATTGRPTWVALRAIPEWRWGIEGAGSPWYPSARLFRQKDAGAWAPVFADIARALRKLLGMQGAPPAL
jgi:tetratricopeptide (TPR) repeat protein